MIFSLIEKEIIINVNHIYRIRLACKPHQQAPGTKKRVDNRDYSPSFEPMQRIGYISAKFCKLKYQLIQKRLHPTQALSLMVFQAELL